MTSNSFSNYHTFNQRAEVAKKIIQSYPDRIPVVIEAMDNKTPIAIKEKYLVPRNSTVSNLMINVRRHVRNLASGQELFFFVNQSKLIGPGTEMNDLYKQYKNDDGFLYITYSLENAYG